jgi:uncharacterized SAM-binding protein YcdF (DUF218 family)
LRGRFVRPWLWLGMILPVLLGLAVWVSYATLPTGNTDATRFDAILVLGVPANWDGSVSPEERSRVMEGVREFRAARAGHMILSGGAAHNPWVEGAVMARFAEEQGIPAEDVIVEGRSLNTIQNIFYSRKIMEQHGWKSVEVVSSASHLPRTALILEQYRGEAGFTWRTHAARWPKEYGWERIAVIYAKEMLETTVLRWFGFRRSRFLPNEQSSGGMSWVRGLPHLRSLG